MRDGELTTYGKLKPGDIFSNEDGERYYYVKLESSSYMGNNAIVKDFSLNKDYYDDDVVRYEGKAAIVRSI